MDITFKTSPKLEALRHEVRSWLDDELPEEYEGFQWDFEEDPKRWDFYRQFWKKQGAKRWLEQPHPTLDNRPPKDAAADIEFFPKVLGLLQERLAVAA